MNSEYQQLMSELNTIKSQKARTFENSLLYQKEIITFLGEVAKLNERYTSVSNSLSSIQTKFDQTRYVNTFENINYVASELQGIISKISSVDSMIRKGSKTTYNELDSEFNSLYDATLDMLDSALSSLKNYEIVNQRLHSLNYHNVNYNSTYSELSDQRSQYENAFHNYISQAKASMQTLAELLEKGVKNA